MFADPCDQAECELLDSAFCALKQERFDRYDDWLKVGMALKSVGDPRLFLAWDVRSRASANYGNTREKWNSFTEDGGITIGTIFKMAREDGWEPEGQARTRTEPPLKLVDELRLARHFLSQNQRDGESTICFFRDGWYEWSSYWRELDSQQLTNRVYGVCKAYVMAESAKLPPDSKGERPSAPALGKSIIANAEMAIKSLVSVNETGWRDGRGGRWLAFRDKVLDLDAWLDERVVCLPQTPQFFAPNSLDYDLSYTDDEPSLLLERLREQFTDAEVCAIQEFGGYAMQVESKIQRILCLIGPPRSFKGSLERVIRRSIGEHNAASKTLESFLSAHALEDLPSKLFLGISDSRPDPKLSKRAVERLLGISGGDPQNINPKGRTHFTVTLPCKLMLASNIIPDFDDPTGALLSRFLFVASTVSFVGREDPELLDKILTQQNEIAWWFLRGLRRLLKAGRYTEPTNDLKSKFAEHNSPVRSFVDQCCELRGEVDKVVLHDAFVDWCEQRQIKPTSKDDFYRDLYASQRDITSKRAREGDARPYRVHGISLRVAA